MDAEIPAYPFTPWTPVEVAEALARLPRMAEADLRDLAECLAEGWQDLPDGMQRYYRAVRAELAGRRELERAA